MDNDRSGAADFPNIVQSWSDRLHPDDAVAALAALKSHMADRSGTLGDNAEYRLKKKDGPYG